MTKEECINELARIQQECLDAQRAAYKKKVDDTTDALMAWANSDPPYKCGDHIISDGKALEIVGIKGMQGAKKNSLVRVYHCRVLTKTFRPRGDGMMKDIYDDVSHIETI